MVYLITGGTGTLGQALTEYILKNEVVTKLIIYSRDELKQSEMKEKFKDDRLRFFIGDVTDYNRLDRSLNSVDYVIHAAAMKRIEVIEENPFEALKTNVNGAKNLIDCCINNRVKRVVALSTDKACLPITFYGGTKFLSDKLFQEGRVYCQNHGIKMSVVRYGNVMGSRGSVILRYKFLKALGKKSLPLTDEQMTRFWITIQEAVRLVILALHEGQGGEIFVSKIPSFYMKDLIQALDCNYHLIGIRGEEKLHEDLINIYDDCYELEDHYRLYPKNYEGQKIGNKLNSFSLDSKNNNHILSIDEIKLKLDNLNG